MKKNFIIPTLALVLSMSLGTHFAEAASATPAAIIAKADTAITARITSLNKLNAKIAKFKNISDTQKASLTATVQSSIDAMSALKTKIDAETDITALKADYSTIAKNYRIYMVVLPSESAIAAADNTLGGLTYIQTTLAKLNTRITTAKAAGKDVTALEKSYADATIQLADAQTQANAIITGLGSLKPDMGDKTVQASNALVIKAAKTNRTNITKDITTIKSDIKTIQAGLKALKIK